MTGKVVPLLTVLHVMVTLLSIARQDELSWYVTNDIPVASLTYRLCRGL